MNVAIEAGVLNGNAQMTMVRIVASRAIEYVVRLFDLVDARPIVAVLRSIGNTLNAPNTNFYGGRTAGARA